MYNDTLKVANKIINDHDLFEIFQKMDENIKKYNQLCKQESIHNQSLENEYQHWTVKSFEGSMRSTINFYDDTTITVDNYNSFVTIFNNRLDEIKDMWIVYSYLYWVQDGSNKKFISQHINMSIYENKMELDVSLCSDDEKMNDIYCLIKNIILHSPERYDHVIKKKSTITGKIVFAVGMIPSLILCSLLMLIPTVRGIYGITYVLFPLAVVILASVVGNTVIGGKLDRLYSSLLPDKKYVGYDSTNNKSIYKDDIDDYLTKSEIIIGKNANNIKNRKEIEELEKKYSKYITSEIIALLALSIIAIVIGNI